MSRKEAGLPRSHFLILLALADSARHGLGIVEEIEVRTAGAVQIGPGTLYGTLKKLAADGWVEETDTPPDPNDHDTRRRYYALTEAGRLALAEEAAVMRDLVTTATAKDVLTEGGRG